MHPDAIKPYAACQWLCFAVTVRRRPRGHYVGASLGRPSTPVISKERAVRAALDVIDTQGIEGLSLALVAQRLGVKAPSLYYHFHNKAELLEEVARLLLVDAAVPDIELHPSDWRETLVTLAVEVRRSILRHPAAAPLMLQFFPRNLLLAAYDRWISIYEAPPADHMLIIEGVETLTLGSALFAASYRMRGVEPMPPFEPDKLPRLARAIRANHLNEEETFAATLRKFLAAFGA